MDAGNSNIVYHYCKVDTFLSIIQNSTLWLSDIHKLNDYQECVWIRDKIRAEIENWLAETDTVALNAWKTWYTVNANLEDNITTVYTACFSESSDSLSQWRGYAEDGEGIAIGFSKKHLQALSGENPYNLKFNKVIYKKNRQEAFINSIVKETINKMKNKGVGHAATELNSNYLLNFSLYKNPSFAEEKEWRVMLLSAQGWEKLKGDFQGFQFMNSKFRTVDGKLISYLEMNFSKIKRDFIKEIWIGPKSKVSKIDVRNVLLTYNYYKGTSFNVNEPICIRQSNSSYR